MSDAQRATQALLDQLTGDGPELGLQAAAYQEGALVVDAWAGVADPDDGRPVERSTLFNAFSISKGVSSTVVHLLVERDLLAYDTPISHWWPEFASHGKEAITLRHVLTHTAGLPSVPSYLTPADLRDWEAMTRLVAGLTPEWPPGSRTSYHAYTWGWIVGEVARRAAGQPIDQLICEAIAEPLGVADELFPRLPEREVGRVAVLDDEEWLRFQAGLPASSPIRQALPLELTPSRAVYGRPDIQAALLPGGGLIASARALARHYAALIGDGVDGVRLLPAKRVAEATALQTDAFDRGLGSAARKGLGYLLGGPGSVMGGRLTAFGHSGVGGAIAFADPAYRFAFALLKNRLTARWDATDAALQVARRVRESLGIPEEGA